MSVNISDQQVSRSGLKYSNMKKLLIMLLFLPCLLSAQTGTGWNKTNDFKTSFRDSTYFNKGVRGDFKYDLIHAIGSADSVNWSSGTAQNYFYKIAATPFTWRETYGMTAAGDSARILTTGDYEFHVWINATTSNANDQLKVKMFVNNAPLGTTLGMFKINSNGAGAGDTHYYMWYREMTANDYVSFRIANLTGARASVVSDFKIFIKKVPEN